MSVFASAAQVTLNFKSVSLELAFAEIKKQTGYGFWYEKKDLLDLPKVSVSVRNVELRAALEACLKGQPLSYEIFDKTVVLKRKSVTPAVVPPKRSVQDKVRGKVVDAESKEPLAGVLVKVKSPELSVVTNDKGEFELFLTEGKYDILVQYLGYNIREFGVTVPATELLFLELTATENKLNQVEIVNTGYQSLPKERATGSYAVVDKGLLQRTVSTNILDRLEGVTSGLSFSSGGSLTRNQALIEVRGRSTLFSNAEPLVVVDNFPYDGDLANINPNDVENVTVLKDAAAASVWGARAGNGVIVITTKRGKFNTPTSVSVSSNINIGERPNLYYRPQLSSSEYIEVEKFMFGKGAFDPMINNGYAALSPAVEIMLAHRRGEISEQEKEDKLMVLSNYDVREQLSKYFYKPLANLQNQLGISGGGVNQRFYISLGMDRNTGGEINSIYRRYTINANHLYTLLKGKIEISTVMAFSSSRGTNGHGEGGLAYPYSQVADVDGNALAVANLLRPSYIQGLAQGKFLDWYYRPLEEWNKGYSRANVDNKDYRLNLSLKSNLTKWLGATGFFGYEQGNSGNVRLNELNSYYSRNLINQFTQVNSVTGSVTNPLPIGGILTSSEVAMLSLNGRFQLNFNPRWGRHAVDAIAGTEIRDYERLTGSDILYGYNEDTMTNQNNAINTTINFPYSYGTGTSRIVVSPTRQANYNRFISYYFSGSYTFKNTYILSMSARKDMSNIFGVSTNLRGVPLWSIGASWSIDREAFYRWELIDQLKVRSTFGYTGNVNNSLSSLLTAVAAGSQMYNTYNARIENAPNPSLRWERNLTFNLGVDFVTRNQVLSGSIDLWQKTGMDLIGNSPIAPQTGIALYTGNSANTVTKGVDIEVNSRNLNGKFKWFTTMLYNRATNKVTRYKVGNGSNLNVVSGNYNNPLEGYPYYAVFSFKYAGLDNLGNPLAYLGDNSTNDYAMVRNTGNRDYLYYHGSAVPTDFGSLRNTFNYGGFELSFNISYKFGHYFRRGSLDNGSLYSTSGNYQMADYGLRWQKPGDELTTVVPALAYPSNTARTSIYTYANVLVEKADHVRLRDVRLAYSFPKLRSLPLRTLNVFASVSNLGILWRANDKGIDPDYVSGLPLPKTFAFGFRTEF